MPTLVTKTVKPSGGDFTTLKAAIIGAVKDVAFVNTTLTIEVYSGTQDTATIQGADFGTCSTDAASEIVIIAPAGHRHAGVWDATKWNLTAGSGYGGSVLAPKNDINIRFRYLQLTNTSGHGSRPCGIDLFLPGAGKRQLAEGCIVRNTGDQSAPDGAGAAVRYNYGVAAGMIGVINCLLVSFPSYMMAAGYIGIPSTIINYNNTCVGSTVAGVDLSVDPNGGANVRTANLIIQGAGVNYTPPAALRAGATGSNTERTILTQDASGPTAALRSQVLDFVNAAAGNYALAATDAVAIDAGTDLSADADWAFTTDAAGAARPQGAAWDLGALEYVNTAPSSAKVGILTQPTGALNGTSIGTPPVFAIQSSSGTTVANDHGAGGTVTINGGNATFSISQAATLHAGDVLFVNGGYFGVQSFDGTTAQLYNYAPNLTGAAFSIIHNITVSVASGAITLGGPTRVLALDGTATFYRLKVIGAPGTTFTLKASALGLADSVATVSGVLGAATGTFDPKALADRIYVELPRSRPDPVYPTIDGTTTMVTAATLQATLNTVAAYTSSGGGLQNGTKNHEIIIADGEVCSGSYVLPNRGVGATGWILVRSSMTGLPERGTRVKPSDFTTHAIMNVNSNAGAFTTANYMGGTTASGYWLAGLNIRQDPGVAVQTFLELGHIDARQTTLASVPDRLVVDRCYIHGDQNLDNRHGISFEGSNVTVTDSLVVEIHHSGADANAFLSLNGPGPTLIHNCRVSASGEGLICGGGDPKIVGLVPGDITFTKNYVTVPIEWNRKKFGGSHWVVKNHVDLKNVTRLLVEGNVFENMWNDGQDGSSWVLKSNNQESTAPWGGTSDATFRYNLQRNVGSPVTISGAPEGVNCVNLSCLSVHDCLSINNGHFDDLYQFSGTGRGFAFTNGDPVARRTFDVYVDHNTQVWPDTNPGGSVAYEFDGNEAGLFNLRLKNNISSAPHMNGMRSSVANQLAAFTMAVAGSSVALGNVIGDTNGQTDAGYPGNHVTGVTQASIGFAGWPSIVGTWETNDPLLDVSAFTLTSGPYRAGQPSQAPDGTDVGVDAAMLAAMITGVVVPVSGGGPAQVADHLTITRQPSNGAVGIALATQPAGAVKDASGATVTIDTSTVTVSLVVESGAGTMFGTPAAVAVNGVWDFAGHGLGVNTTGVCRAHWHFTDGTLTGIDSAPFTVSASGDPSIVIAGLTILVAEGSVVERVERRDTSYRTNGGDLRPASTREKRAWAMTTALLTIPNANALRAAVAFGAEVECSGALLGSPLIAEVEAEDTVCITAATDGQHLMHALALTIREV